MHEEVVGWPCRYEAVFRSTHNELQEKKNQELLMLQYWPPATRITV